MKQSTYRHFDPCSRLSEYVHSFWIYANQSEEIKTYTFTPDGFFYIIIYYHKNQIVRYLRTGIFTQPTEAKVLPNTIVIGCRFKILATESLFNKPIANLVNQREFFDTEYLNAKNFDISNFDKLKVQWEKELLKLLPNEKPSENKLRLSRLLYKSIGTLSVKEISNQCFWEQKQINRYFNKYLGISLKTYMSIQRTYNACFQIKKGDLSPAPFDMFYDQSHFIKEIKKYTGVSPKVVFKNQDELFSQIHNIKKK